MGLFNRKKTEKATPETDIAADAVEDAGEAGGAESAVNEELIAVISAAVAAYEAEQFVQTLYIQKINRSYNIAPVWAAMGRQEAIDTRRM